MRLRRIGDPHELAEIGGGRPEAAVVIFRIDRNLPMVAVGLMHANPGRRQTLPDPS